MGWPGRGTESSEETFTGDVAQGKEIGDIEMVWTFWRVD